MTKKEKVGMVSGGRPALVYLVPFPGAQFRPEHTPPCKYHPPLWSLSSRSVLHVSQGSALKTIELPAEHLSRKEIHQNIGRSWEISQTGQIIQLQGNIAKDLVQKSSHKNHPTFYSHEGTSGTLDTDSLTPTSPNHNI